MAGPLRRSRGGLLARGTLEEAVRRTSRNALACGALLPIATEPHLVMQGGIRFQVRVALSETATGGGPKVANPFLAPEPELLVGELSSTHRCLLNKYTVVDHHLLIVTRAFAEQDAPLERADFEALWWCIQEYDSIGFYNAGRIAGASQHHRHFQLVPTPLCGGPDRAPLEPLIDHANFDDAMGMAPALPYLHGVARLRGLDTQPTAEAADGLLALYRQMARAFGCNRPGRPYNLLVTRDWMLFVPRSREAWRGIAVNALGFAGALLVPDAEALEQLRTIGPVDLLRRVAVSK